MTGTRRRGVVLGVLAVPLLALLLGLQIAVNVGAFTGQVFATNGAAAEHDGDFATAAWSYGRAAAWNPFEGEYLYKLASARVRQSAPDAAVPAFRESLRRSPDNLPALLGLAQAEARLGRLEAADEALARARAVAPQYWRVALMSGYVAALAGDSATAIAEMEKALTMPFADRGEVLMPLAGAYLAAGDATKGLACADEAAALDPDNSVHLLLRGRALLRLGQPGESLTPLKDYVDRMMREKRADLAMFDAADGFAALAEAYSANGDLLAASDALARMFVGSGPSDPRARQSALDLASRLSVPPTDPAAALACSNVGFTLGGVGELDRAEQLLKAALPLLTGHQRLSCDYNLGVVLTKQGRPREALEPLREAVGLDPSWLDAALAYANALADSGDVANARASYTALLNDPRLSDTLRQAAEKRLASLPAA